MSLTRIGQTGADHPVTHATTYELYQRYKREVPLSRQAVVINYISSQILLKRKFSIATMFPDPWPPQLGHLWEFCRDKTLAAFVLAYIVMDFLRSDSKHWFYTKTNIQDREFESNFYWTNDR
jgi:hypothetical protein